MTIENSTLNIGQIIRGCIFKKRTAMKRLILVLLIILTADNSPSAEGPCMIPGRGYFRIHVGTGGMFGAFAHDHLIEAQKMEGCATIDPGGFAHSSIKLV